MACSHGYSCRQVSTRYHDTLLLCYQASLGSGVESGSLFSQNWNILICLVGLSEGRTRCKLKSPRPSLCFLLLFMSPSSVLSTCGLYPLNLCFSQLWGLSKQPHMPVSSLFLSSGPQVLPLSLSPDPRLLLAQLCLRFLGGGEKGQKLILFFCDAFPSHFRSPSCSR